MGIFTKPKDFGLELLRPFNVYIDCYVLANRNSIWVDTLKAVNQLKNKRVDLLQFCIKKTGDGSSTFFGRILR